MPNGGQAMNRIFVLSLALLVLQCNAAPDKNDVLMKKYFRDNAECVIVCKGYPKEGTAGKAAIGTAAEAALLSAQSIARGMFDDSVDVVKNGEVEKYDIYDGYVVIHYVVRQAGLKSRLKR